MLNLCKNFGKCMEFFDDFECICYIGFYGKVCDSKEIIVFFLFVWVLKCFEMINFVN